jgi:hypothetical protein
VTEHVAMIVVAGRSHRRNLAPNGLSSVTGGSAKPGTTARAEPDAARARPGMIVDVHPGNVIIVEGVNSPRAPRSARPCRFRNGRRDLGSECPFPGLSRCGTLVRRRGPLVDRTVPMHPLHQEFRCYRARSPPVVSPGVRRAAASLPSTSPAGGSAGIPATSPTPNERKSTRYCLIWRVWRVGAGVGRSTAAG